MAGYHTMTLFLPKPAARWLATFYRLLTAATSLYQAVEVEEQWEGWETVMFLSTPAHDLLQVYLCRGPHFEQLTTAYAARQQHFLGYMSIYAMLKFYYHVLKTGHYVEVVAYSEDMLQGDVVSDLYVRVPAVHTDLYAVIPSTCTIEEVYKNDFRRWNIETMWRMGWQCAAMKDFKLPMFQSIPLTAEQEDWHVNHLDAIIPRDLYDEVFLFASFVRSRYYVVDYREGESLPRPDDDQRKVLGAICGVLHGVFLSKVYAEVKACLDLGPGQLG